MHPQTSLFDLELKESEEKPERLDIVTTTLHYEASELAQFKKLCKKLMPEFFDDLEDANINDLLLLLLKKEHEKSDQKEADDGQGSREAASKVRRHNNVRHRNRGRLRRIRQLRKLVV